MLSERQLADKLGLAPSTVSERVHKAIAGGWLVNEESKPGVPARLKIGSSMPNPDSSLPTVADLGRAYE